MDLDNDDLTPISSSLHVPATVSPVLHTPAVFSNPRSPHTPTVFPSPRSSYTPAVPPSPRLPHTSAADPIDSDPLAQVSDGLDPNPAPKAGVNKPETKSKIIHRALNGERLFAFTRQSILNIL
jgi:hypothetical protein